ncbi:MAG: GNAT family N-acetyltransferase [Promethearchaeota archaeon]
MKNWKIRRYKHGDEEQIIQLFQKVFGKHMGKTESIKHWKWEFEYNPINRNEIFLAINANKLVGQYAVIPVKMKIGIKEYTATLSLDTMTHPDYRGQGIFPTLATNLYNDLGKSGISITYGFPNTLSIYGFIKKLNWFEISKVPIYIRPLNFISLFHYYLKNNFLSQFFGSIANFFYNLFLKKKKMPSYLKIEKIKDFGIEFNVLWKIIKREIPIGIVRDSKYLNWRYFQKPEEKYVVFSIKNNEKLKGYIILKIEERFDLKIGLIMDILSDPSNVIYQNQLINYAIFYFKKKKVDIISLIMFPNWRYYKSLKKYLFIKMFKKFFPEEIYFGARINKDNVDIQLIKDPKNWYITWGDTDVV